MIIEKSSRLEPLELTRLQEILRAPGPCITIVLPPYHPGEPAKSAATRLKIDIQDAIRALDEQGYPKAKTDCLLAPLEQLLNDPASLTGSRWGSVIFCSPDVFCQFQLLQSLKPSITVAGCFAIRRLLSELSMPKLFYLLALSKESVRLFRCTGEGAEAIELPAGFPSTLEEALALEPPDHDLENRAAISTSTGSMHAVRFGTGSGRETKYLHLLDFYKLVDRGIHKMLHAPGAPLILAGVEEEVVAYRAVSSHRNLAKTALHGSPNLVSPVEETVTRAIALLRAEQVQREVEALMDAKEDALPGRFVTDPGAILSAAFDGRVRQLYLNEGAAFIGSYRTWFEEELLNLAAVETLGKGGQAFELPAGLMPDGEAAVAILRY